jgi:hypothetical protein
MFAAYARSVGLETRIWALEGKRFDGKAHTIPEVYLPELDRWVMLDVTLNAFARSPTGVPLGILDLRDRVLAGAADSLQFLPLDPAASFGGRALINYYSDVSRYVFLRRDGGLAAEGRYGVLAPLSGWLDWLPEGPKKGAAAFLGGTGHVLYYHDAHNVTLMPTARVAKLCGLLFVLSLVGVLVAATRALGQT